MPEYLAPGVYVEETSFRSKTIEGVSTSTAGFVGPARSGPVEGEPELLTSFHDFERIYGGLDQLEHEGTSYHNYLAHAVRAFFEEGGKRLYVSRVAVAEAAEVGGGAAQSEKPAKHASKEIGSGTTKITLTARHPGQAGNFLVTFSFRMGPNVLHEEENLSTGESTAALRGASHYDLVLVRRGATSPPGAPTSPPSSDELFWLERFRDTEHDRYDFRLRKNNPTDSGSSATKVSDLHPAADSQGDRLHVITVNVTIGPMGEFIPAQTWENLTFHPQHGDSLSRTFETQADRLDRRTVLYVPLVVKTDLTNGAEIARLFLSQTSRKKISPPETLLEELSMSDGSEGPVTFQIELENGTDGSRPGANEYEGEEYDGAVDEKHPAKGAKNGLLAFEDLEDISIVAAPGSTYISSDDKGYEKQRDTIQRHLIAHCENMRYRIAVLDSTNGQLVSEIRDYRGKLDSKYAALYYPWVCILDPVTEQVIKLPPSGFVAGIYARNDIESGVHKAPANEVVRMAIGFELLLNKGQQDVLNPEGINCFRFFEGRGYRLWGARTITSDPEWKYVNLRRYFAYLERSIDKGTQWAVFENNSTPLWENIRQTVYDFLYNEWRNDRLMGDNPKEAFFVRCDRSTMTQNDIDNGRLVCLVGVAPVRPAEFVIFRIGQWTADRRG